MNEVDTYARIICGGGDVKCNMITTMAEQREILLTAGDGNVVEKIDLAELARGGAPPLLFLQPAYHCSSANVVIRSIGCDASTMSWARAPYVYKTSPLSDHFTPAILCLAGRTLVWCECLQPGDSRDFALGNVIAVTTNVAASLRPTTQCHPHDHQAAMIEQSGPDGDERLSRAENERSTAAARRRFQEFRATLKVLFESIRAREGFFVCELTNRSNKPAYVFTQLNKSAFYGGSGLVGFVIRIASSFLRLSHWPM
jgi:hypothetical protein